jgi:Ni/Fe-hydrogenase 1 B-type cytochrome subunit
MATATRTRKDPPRSGRRSVYVWELPVRLVHWTIVLTLIVLSATGYYIYNPFLGGGTRGLSGASGIGFTMGWMRFIHESAGFVFTAAVLLRVYWAFAGNRFAHWRALLPITRAQRHDLLAMVRFYVLRQRHPPPANGHNPLAAMAYLGVYGLFALSILSGFGLFAWVSRIPLWMTLFGWTYHHLLPIQQLRVLHLVLMFVFGAFTVHHVYSAVLVDLDERNGELSSIITGYKSDVLDESPDDDGGPEA